MYNDYYLQRIDAKLEDVIDLQDSIINNQASIISYQQQQLSGDRELRIQLAQNNNVTMILALIVCASFIYNFIVRCLK